MLKMRNKKADILLSEGLKLFLALACIILLLYLAYNLYSIFFIAKNELEQARATLSQIIGKIGTLEKEGDNADYTLTAPSSWYIVNYDKDVVAGNEEWAMPVQCKGESCLCVCPSKKAGLTKSPLSIEGVDDYSAVDYFYKQGLDLCEKEGVCTDYNNKIIVRKINFYQADWPFKWSPITETKAAEVNWIMITSRAKSLVIKKEKDAIAIYEGKQNEEIIDRLLNTRIEFGMATNIPVSVFINQYFANNCENEDFEINSEAEAKLYETISIYLNELVEKKQIEGAYIYIFRISKATGSLLYAVSIYGGSGTGTFPITEQKVFCDEKVIFLIKADVRKNG